MADSLVAAAVGARSWKGKITKCRVKDRPPANQIRAESDLQRLSWWKGTSFINSLRRSLVPVAILLVLFLALWVLLKALLATGMSLFILTVIEAVPLLSPLLEP